MEISVSGIVWVRQGGNVTITSGSNGSIWTNVSGIATYYDGVNITGNYSNLTVRGHGLYYGHYNKSQLYQIGNVRFGGFGSFIPTWGSVSLETDTTRLGGTDTIWTIDNGGGNIRIYETTPAADQYARFRINSSEITLGESVAGREIDYHITGDTYAEGHMDVEKNFTGNQIYGGMWYHNHTGTTLNFAVDSQYYSLYALNATHLNGFTANNIGTGLNSSLQTQVAGLYHASYMGTGDGENNHLYYTSIFVNDVNNEWCEYHHKMAAGGDIVTHAATCFIDLNIGDNVSVRTADIGGTSTGNYYDMNLNLVRIGD